MTSSSSGKGFPPIELGSYHLRSNKKAGVLTPAIHPLALPGAARTTGYGGSATLDEWKGSRLILLIAHHALFAGHMAHYTNATCRLYMLCAQNTIGRLDD